MKKMLWFSLLFVSICALSQSDTAKIEFVTPPDSTAIGKPDGKPVSKEIGISGGEIISDDGRVKLIFPEGALTQNIVISIQPVINHAPNSIGKAYRFEPSGIEFKRPVHLIMNYTADEADETPFQLMSLASQNEKGKWSFMRYESYDSIAKTLTAKISHFSSYSNVADIKLEPEKRRLRVNEKTIIRIVDISYELSSLTGDVSVYEVASLDPKNTTTSWYAQNYPDGNAIWGTLQEITSKDLKNVYARYTAPGQLPPKDPVIIRLDVAILLRKGKDVNVSETKSLKTRIHIYDAYQVNLTTDCDMSGGDCGVRAYDEVSFVTEIDYGSVTLADIRNRNMKLTYSPCPKCKALYANETTAKGHLHLNGLAGFKITAGDAGIASPAKVELSFLPARGELPVTYFQCGDVTSVTPFLQIPAFPNNQRKFIFYTKEEEQVLFNLNEKGCKSRVTVKRWKPK